MFTENSDLKINPLFTTMKAAKMKKPEFQLFSAGQKTRFPG